MTNLVPMTTVHTMQLRPGRRLALMISQMTGVILMPTSHAVEVAAGAVNGAGSRIVTLGMGSIHAVRDWLRTLSVFVRIVITAMAIGTKGCRTSSGSAWS